MGATGEQGSPTTGAPTATVPRAGRETNTSSAALRGTWERGRADLERPSPAPFGGEGPIRAGTLLRPSLKEWSTSEDRDDEALSRRRLPPLAPRGDGDRAAWKPAADVAAARVSTGGSMPGRDSGKRIARAVAPTGRAARREACPAVSATAATAWEAPRAAAGERGPAGRGATAGVAGAAAGKAADGAGSGAKVDDLGGKATLGGTVSAPTSTPDGAALDAMKVRQGESAGAIDSGPGGTPGKHEVSINSTSHPNTCSRSGGRATIADVLTHTATTPTSETTGST